MKKIVLAISLSLLIGGFNLCLAQKKDKNKKEENTVQLKTLKDTISYIIGVDIANNFKRSSIDVNPDILAQGFKDATNGNDSLIPEDTRTAIMTKFQQSLQTKQQEKMTKESGDNKAKGIAFLVENKKKEGVVELPSGLQYKVIKEGAGTKPLATDKVTVNYEGKLIDGTIFDSSYKRGQPVTFPLNGVIPGWTEGVQLMSPGAIYEFYIPANLGYGDRGAGASIPGGSTLIFKVELISIGGAE